MSGEYTKAACVATKKIKELLKESKKCLAYMDLVTVSSSDAKKAFKITRRAFLKFSYKIFVDDVPELLPDEIVAVKEEVVKLLQSCRVCLGLGEQAIEKSWDYDEYVTVSQVCSSLSIIVDLAEDAAFTLLAIQDLVYKDKESRNAYKEWYRLLQEAANSFLSMKFGSEDPQDAFIHYRMARVHVKSISQAIDDFEPLCRGVRHNMSLVNVETDIIRLESVIEGGDGTENLKLLVNKLNGIQSLLKNSTEIANV